jgi:Na+/phosphate symporter
MQISRTAIKYLVQFIAGGLIMIGLDAGEAQALADTLGTSLEALIGAGLAVLAAIDAGLRKLTSAPMAPGGVKGLIYKRPQ